MRFCGCYRRQTLDLLATAYAEAGRFAEVGRNGPQGRGPRHTHKLRLYEAGKLVRFAAVAVTCSGPTLTVQSRVTRSVPMAISPSRPRIVDFIAWALLAIALIFAVYVRVRLREFPLERDEGEFAYAGQLILQGVPPYKLAYNMKLPGTYIAYAALMAVFGQTTAGIHLGLLAVNLATIVLLYRFVRELFDPFSAGMAAVAYSILSVSPAMLGMAAHATHFVAFFGLAGPICSGGTCNRAAGGRQLASGLLMGIAFLMKQQGVFLMIFGGGFLLLLGLRLAAYPRKRLPVALGLYSLAAVLPYGLICLWLWRAGVWEKFWFWTVEYASKYVQNVPLSLAADVFVAERLRHRPAELAPVAAGLGRNCGSRDSRAGQAGPAVLRVRIPGLLLLLRLSGLLLPPALFHCHAARRGDVGRGWLPVALGFGFRPILVEEAATSTTAEQRAPAPAARQKRRTFQARQARAQPVSGWRIRPFAGAGGPAVAGGGGWDLMDAK